MSDKPKIGDKVFWADSKFDIRTGAVIAVGIDWVHVREAAPIHAVRIAQLGENPWRRDPA